MSETRQLIDLVSVGPATLDDFTLLGITEVEQLVGRDAHDLFEQLQEVTHRKHDPCCEDVFSAAIAQADDPDLPPEKCQWPYWSKVRKAGR